MAEPGDLIRWCRAERARLQQRVEQLVKGELKIWERRGLPPAHTRDVTDEAITQARRAISELDAILANASNAE